MKSRLIILSDLWGKEKSAWMDYYKSRLNKKFEITYYDCCELGNIDKSDYTEENLHKQFVACGIDRAVRQLLALEKENTTILAFSVGGVIAWKFGIEHQKIESFYCVSPTRLRHETIKPAGKIELYFGSEDQYKPTKEWFDKMNVQYNIADGSHLLYTDPLFAEQLCTRILKQKD